MARITFRDYKLNLLANQPQALSVPGDFYQVITANGEIKLSFDQSAAISRFQGMGGPVGYNESVTITSPIDQTIVISLGFTDNSAPYDSRGNFAGGTINVSVNASSTITAVPDGAVPATSQLLLLAADATRRDAVICVDSTQVGALRIGNSATDATHGVLVEPGSTIVLTTTAGIYAFNPNASAVTPSITVTKV